MIIIYSISKYIQKNISCIFDIYILGYLKGYSSRFCDIMLEVEIWILLKITIITNQRLIGVIVLKFIFVSSKSLKCKIIIIIYFIHAASCRGGPTDVV